MEADTALSAAGCGCFGVSVGDPPHAIAARAPPEPSS